MDTGVPALKSIDVLLPAASAVLSRLLVADLPPDFLQDSLLSLQAELGSEPELFSFCDVGQCVRP